MTNLLFVAGNSRKQSQNTQLVKTALKTVQQSADGDIITTATELGAH